MFGGFRDWGRDKAAEFAFDQVIAALTAGPSKPNDEPSEGTLILNRILDRIATDEKSRMALANALMKWICNVLLMPVEHEEKENQPAALSEENKQKLTRAILGVLSNITAPQKAGPYMVDVALILISTDRISGELREKLMDVIAGQLGSLTDGQRGQLSDNLFKLLKNLGDSDIAADHLSQLAEVAIKTDKGSEIAATAAKKFIENRIKSPELAKELEPLIRNAFRSGDFTDSLYTGLKNRSVKFSGPEAAIYAGLSRQAKAAADRVDEMLRASLDDPEYQLMKTIQTMNSGIGQPDEKDEKDEKYDLNAIPATLPRFAESPLFYYSRIEPLLKNTADLLPYAGQILSDINIILDQNNNPAMRFEALLNLIAAIEPMEKFFFHGSKKTLEELIAHMSRDGFPGAAEFRDQIATVFAVADILEKIKNSEQIRTLMKDMLDPAKDSFDSMRDIGREMKAIANPQAPNIEDKPLDAHAIEQGTHSLEKMAALLSNQVALLENEKIDQNTRRHIRQSLNAVLSAIDKHRQYSGTSQNSLQLMLFLMSVAGDVHTLMQSGSKAGEALSAAFFEDYLAIMRLVNEQCKKTLLEMDTFEIRHRLSPGCLTKLSFGSQNDVIISAPSEVPAEKFVENKLAENQMKIITWNENADPGTICVQWLDGILRYKVTKKDGALHHGTIPGIPRPEEGVTEQSLAPLRNQILHETEKAGHTRAPLHGRVFVRQDDRLICVYVHADTVIPEKTHSVAAAYEEKDFSHSVANMDVSSDKMIPLTDQQRNILRAFTEVGESDDISLYSLIEKISEFSDVDTPMGRFRFPPQERPPFSKALREQRETMYKEATKKAEGANPKTIAGLSATNYRDMLNRRVSKAEASLTSEKNIRRNKNADAHMAWLHARNELLQPLLSNAIQRLHQELQSSPSAVKQKKHDFLLSLEKSLMQAHDADRIAAAAEYDHYDPSMSFQELISTIDDTEPLRDGRTKDVLTEVKQILAGPESIRQEIRQAIMALTDARDSNASHASAQKRETRLAALNFLLSLLSIEGVRPSWALQVMARTHSDLHKVLMKYDSTLVDKITETEKTIEKNFGHQMSHYIFGAVANSDYLIARINSKQPRMVSRESANTALDLINRRISELQERQNLILEFFYRDRRDRKIALLQEAGKRMYDKYSESEGNPSLTSILDDMSKDPAYTKDMHLLYLGKTGRMIHSLQNKQLSRQDILARIDLEIERLQLKRTEPRPLFAFFLNPAQDAQQISQHIAALRTLKTNLEEGNEPVNDRNVRNIIEKLDEETKTLLEGNFPHLTKTFQTPAADA